MDLWELLLLGVVGWTALGLAGIFVSSRRARQGVSGERERVRRGALWIAGIWAVYLGAVVVVSLRQPQRVLKIGQEECFGKLCFAVSGMEEMPGFLIRDGSRLVRVSVRMRNKARAGSQSDGLMRAYLVDAEGRRWKESTGVGGVRLTANVTAGESVVSEPVFKVAADATGLRLVFTRGWKQPGILVVGDSDSLLHRRTVVELGR
jgi:hypothetical protein